MKRTVSRLMILLAAALLIHQVMQADSEACNVAVVSAKTSATGRPFIWKNRDHPDSYRHEVRYYPEVKTGVGGSVRLMGETTFYDGKTFPWWLGGGPNAVRVGGANESGFAIANTTCYESATLEKDNVNTNLMEKALEDCKTLAEFEDLAGRFTSVWSGKNISGIFAVIDAYGGAAIYEMWTDGNGKAIKYRKYNVDTGAVTDENGSNFTDLRFPRQRVFRTVRTVTIQMVLYRYGQTHRGNSGPVELLSGMQSEALSPRNIMRVLSKDVLGGDTADYCSDKIFNGSWITNGYTADNGDTWDVLVQKDWNTAGDSWDDPNDEGEMFTRYAISRYQTSMGLVIEGADGEEQAKLTTMWVSLCEPSLSVFVPYFPYAQTISKYAIDDSHGNSGYYWDGSSTSSDKEDNCFLNLLFDCVQDNPFSSSHALYDTYNNISLYSNNGVLKIDEPSERIESSSTYMDNTINYPRLRTLQQWTFPLEDIVIRNTDLLMAVLRKHPELVTRDLLSGFSDYCNGFVYANYSNQSAAYKAWAYELPAAIDDVVDDEEIPDDYSDPDNEDPYYGDPDYDGEGDYSDPGSLVKSNPSANSAGCGMSVFASSGRISSADRMSGFVSLMITMLFPLALIMMHRACRKRRD